MRGDAQAAAGDVAVAMARHDWASTPLGPREGWPLELRSLLRVLEASRFSMWLGWGPELLFFYNDAYRRDTLGIKHPWALGRPAREVWAEAWDDLVPRIEQVTAHGQATWDEALLLVLERRGYREETYHTFSYSPITSEQGAVLGLLCVVSEETDRVIGERRMATVRQLASDLSERWTEDDVLAVVARRLGANLADLPFTCIYLQDEAGGSSRLGCVSGIAPGDPAAPEVNDAAAGPWPLGAVPPSAGLLVVDDVRERFPALPTGAWTEPPERALIAPLLNPTLGRPMGHLVAALNPLRPVDEEYAGFVQVLAGQIAASLEGARAFARERRRAEALAELDRAKTTFFSNVSHEFRTPLTLMLGPLENAIEAEDDPRVRDELVVVRRNGARLLRLVNSLLDFSRIEAGRIDAHFEPTDLSALTADLVSVFRSAYEAAGLEVRTDLAPGPGTVHVDRDMWEKVLLNLLSNALKHTFEGGVHVSLAAEDGHAVLRVRDTGLGIPAHELPRLFERFHRVEGARARTVEGTGIGLALVRELVALHGGTIAAESTLGAGTTMTVAVPLGTAHLPPDRVAHQAPAPAGVAGAAPFIEEALQWLPGGAQVDHEPPAPDREGRVLVVDDNPDMRDYLRRLLAPHYRVEVARDAETALERIAAGPPDLVVSDVMMPGIGGLELVRRLRGDPTTALLPVVLLSARAGEEAAAEGLLLGADDYLVKPFSARELIARVSAHLELGRGRREGEARFRRLADATPALIWVAQPDGRCVFLNRSWLDYTGRDLAEQLGDGWLMSIHPDDRPGAERAWMRAVREGRPVEMEYRLRRHDGAYRWHLDRGVPLAGGDEPAAYVGSVMDIHARRLERERDAFLASVTTELDQEIGLRQRLERLVHLSADGRMADLASISLAEPDGELVRTAQAAADPARLALLERLQAQAPLTVHVMERQRPALIAELTDEVLVANSRPEDLPVRRALGVRSTVIVPLSARGRGLGVLAVSRTGAVPFDEADLVLFTEVGRRAGLALDNALVYERERRLSLTLQRSLLPGRLPDPERVTLATHYAPGTSGTEAGGDWYDALELPDGRVAVAVGDVVGRGAEAAAVMGQLRSALNAFLSEGHGPADALLRLNAVASRSEGALATTAVCAVLDPGRGSARIASAGHPPALHLHAGGARLVEDGRGPALGVRGDARYREQEVPMAPGDALLLFSDGLFERRERRLEEGIARLAARAAEAAGRPAAAVVEHVRAGLLADDGGDDDVVVLAARMSRPSWRGSWPARADQLVHLRRACRDWAAGLGMAPAEIEDLVLGLGEAAANAVEHAYAGREPGDLVVSGRETAEGVVVTVADRGRWRPPEPRGARGGGRGLLLMRAVMDRVEVRPGEEGTEVALHGRRGASRPAVVVTPPPPAPARAALPPPGRPPGEVLVVAAEEVDSATAPGELERLREALRGAGCVRYDLRGVRYMGSAGVALIARAAAEARGDGHRLVVTLAPGGPADRLLAMTGVGGLVDVQVDGHPSRAGTSGADEPAGQAPVGP